MRVTVSEVFRSIQGEGRFMGWPMTFVRLTRCNIDCTWCDTPQRFTGDKMEWVDLVGKVLDLGVERVCFTGGEPLLQLRRPEVKEALAVFAQSHKLHLETNGTLPPDPALLSLFECVSVSPKPPSAQSSRAWRSQLEKRPVFIPAMFRQWVELANRAPNVVFKIVLATEYDWQWFEALAPDLGSAEVIIQPQTYDPAWASKMAARIDSHLGRPLAPGMRFMPRYHDTLWGDAPGR